MPLPSHPSRDEWNHRCDDLWLSQHLLDGLVVSVMSFAQMFHESNRPPRHLNRGWDSYPSPEPRTPFHFPRNLIGDLGVFVDHQHTAATSDRLFRGTIIWTYTITSCGFRMVSLRAIVDVECLGLHVSKL